LDAGRGLKNPVLRNAFKKYIIYFKMLPKINRLKKKKDFALVFKKGEGFQNDFLFIKVAKNNLKSSRFGFITSKSFSKKAVVRNKIKRRLREIVRLNIEGIKKGIDIIFIAKSGLEKKTFSQTVQTVENLLKKGKLV